jgi:hypothetical protein
VNQTSDEPYRLAIPMGDQDHRCPSLAVVLDPEIVEALARRCREAWIGEEAAVSERAPAEGPQRGQIVI